MSIVLSILQLIGWFLLIVILLVVLALLVILFCPVRYFVEGEWREEQWLKAKILWLLHLFGVKVSYGDDLIYGEFWILWKKKTFSVDLSKKKADTEDYTENVAGDFVEDIDDTVVEMAEPVKEANAEKIIGTETTEELRGKASESQEDIETNDTIEENDEILKTQTEDGLEKTSDITSEETVSDEKVESIISKIKGIIERIREVYGKIKKILSDEKNQEAVTHIKNEIIYLIKILLPKKSKIDAVYSTGSPDTTGQLFGVLACFPAFYHKNWKLLPDFEADDAYFKGSFMGKGRVYGYQIVGIILRILFDKNCRRLYTIINKFLKWMKKDEKSEVK